MIKQATFHSHFSLTASYTHRGHTTPNERRINVASALISYQVECTLYRSAELTPKHTEHVTYHDPACRARS